jgi:hypothetical protein
MLQCSSVRILEVRCSFRKLDTGSPLSGRRNHEVVRFEKLHKEQRMNTQLNFKNRTLKLALVSAFALGSIGFGINSHAATTTAAGNATVVANMGITKTLDLRFGKFSAGTGGEVVMSTASGRSKTGAVMLSALDAGGAASFNVTGDTTATYAITLPGATLITHTDAVTTMSIGTFNSNPSGTGTLTAGAQTLLVGGTLTVASAQLAGLYSGTFSVTVDYN